MSLIDGTGLIEWEGGLFDPANPDSMDLLARLRWAFAKLRSEGISISLTEAGRPFGVYSDRYVRDASQTASGRSTVNFQYGRMLRGETPEAANPANGELASDHTKGIASDTNTQQMQRRREVFAEVGLRFNIPRESWHSIKEGPWPFDLSAWAGLDFTPIDNRTPEEKEWDDIMANADDIIKAIKDAAGQSASGYAIIRDYEKQVVDLVFGTDSIVRLGNDVDVAATARAHAVIGRLPVLAPQANELHEPYVRWGVQLNHAEFEGWEASFPGKKVGVPEKKA